MINFKNSTLDVLSELNAEYQREGYVVVPNVVAENHLEQSQEEIIRLVNEAADGKLKSAITWFDYPTSRNEVNVAEIVYPLEERGESLRGVIEAISSIDYVSIFSGVLGCRLQDYEATVMRFHVTTGSHKYAQPWHRDSQKDELDYNTGAAPELVKINVYLFDEVGFKIIPKSVEFFNKDTTNDALIWSESTQPKNHTFFKIDGEKTIKARKGDMLFFHPDLFHRGYSSGFRCSLHILLERKDRQGPRFPEFGNYNGLSYTPRAKMPAIVQARASRYRQFKNLCMYYSPIPSKQWFLNVLKVAKYQGKITNVLFHRPSAYQD